MLTYANVQKPPATAVGWLAVGRPPRATTHGQRSFILLALLLPLLWLHAARASAVPPSASLEVDPTPRLLVRLARRVSMQSAEIRAEFAHIALTEMFLSYLAESLTAQERLLDTFDQSLPRWIGAVDQYAARLQAMAQNPGDDVQVLLRPGEHEPLVLLINGDAVMVSSVRWAQQSDLEHQIVERFCQRRRCTGVTARSGGQGAQSASGGRQSVAPVWHLSGTGPSCRDDSGLALQFADMAHMQRKREACQKIISELDTLVTELARQRRRGLRVDWNQVRVLPQLGSRGYAVRVNSAGELLWLDLPALASARRLFPQIAPWLAARASGMDVSLVIADADTVIAPLLRR